MFLPSLPVLKKRNTELLRVQFLIEIVDVEILRWCFGDFTMFVQHWIFIPYVSCVSESKKMDDTLMVRK